MLSMMHHSCSLSIQLLTFLLQIDTEGIISLMHDQQPKYCDIQPWVFKKRQILCLWKGRMSPNFPVFKGDFSLAQE